MLIPYLASSQGGGYLGTASLGMVWERKTPSYKDRHVLKHLTEFHLGDKIFIHLQPVCFSCPMHYELQERAHTLLQSMLSSSKDHVKEVQDKID